VAKKVRRKTSLDTTAEGIGAALGQLAARLDSWKAQRAELTTDIQRLVKSARSYLTDLGHAQEDEYVTAPPAPRNKGGRPKGHKVSAVTKAKLRAAWKRRRAAAAR
jgi:hypothetical protein